MKSRPSTISKISPLFLDNVLRRQRLFILLDRKSPKNSFWISGPAGSGKTSLVASYLRERNIPHLWYQVDAMDGDPTIFFHYLGQAATSLQPSPAWQIPLLTPEHRLNLESFIFDYFQTLYQRIRPGSWLIFDNFQDAPEESPLLQIITSAIKKLPKDMSIVVISRDEPPAAVSRFIANRTMHAIGGSRMRFTREEFAAFLKCTNPGLSEDAGKRLYRITNGWIAGAIMWLLHAEEEFFPETFATEHIPQNILDYFSAEILDKMSCPLYHFLLQSAHLPHITADMAGELTDMPAADNLKILKRKNYFVEKCRLPDVTYQYHALFRRFLLITAARVYPAASLREMRCRAAGILQKKGWKKAAIDLYIKAGAHDATASIISTVAPSLIAKGRYATLSAWIDLLPCDYSQKNPWLLLWQGQAQMTGNAPASQTLCTMAYNMFHDSCDITGQIYSWATTVETIYIVRDGFTDLDLCIKAGERLAALLPAQENAGDLTGRLAASMLLALLLRNQGHPDLEKWQKRCEVLLDHCHDPLVTADLMKNLFLSYQWLGQVHKAQRIEEQLQIMCNADEVLPLVQVTLRYTMTLAALIAGDHRRCLEEAAKALTLADKTGIHIHDVMVLTQSAYAMLATGELDRIETTLNRMQGSVMPFAIWEQAHYHFLQAWYALQCGKLLTARSETATASMLLETCGNPFTIALSRVLQSQLLLEIGETDKVAGLLTAVIKEQRLGNSKVLHFISQLSLADCAATGNQAKKARHHLSAAFSIARLNGPLLPFSLSSKRLAFLCRLALEAGIEVDAVKDVIKCWRLCPLEAPSVSELWPWPVRIYTLGRFAIHCHDKPLRSRSKPQRKPLELLTCIISGGERSILKETIAARLWPDADGDRALQNLNTTLHRLRKLLGSDGAVVLRNGQLILNSRFCWVDARHFAWLAQQIDIPPASPLKKKYLCRALQMYQGPYMTGHDHLPVAISYKEQLEKLWHYTLAAAIPLFVETASAHHYVLEKALAVDNTAASVLPLFVNTLRNRGKSAEACAIVHRCEALLAEQGISFGSKTQALLRHLFPSKG